MLTVVPSGSGNHLKVRLRWDFAFYSSPMEHDEGRKTTVFVTERSFCLAGPAAMESSTARPGEDVSATMMRRARCSRTSRYSMDTSLNMQMLLEEINGSGVLDPRALRANFSLCRLWKWIHRVEGICADADGAEDANGWTAKGLSESGVWQLLCLDAEGTSSESFFSESLKCTMFDSPERRLALTSCGWAGSFNLSSVLTECEILGDFERSAALAVWHGNIGAAVEALQHASEYVRNRITQQETGSRGYDVSPQYAETLDLVAMCIAGYGGNTEPASRIWKNACRSLLKRDDLSVDTSADSRIAYLRGLCQFLMHVGTPEGLTEVLDSTLR